jgi:hypothetical protein
MSKASLPGVLLVTCALLAMPLHAETDTCRHGPWGPDDEIGAANRITAERVQAAAQLVKRGKTQHLGIVVDADTPAFGPRSLSLQIVQPGQEWGRSPFANGFNYNDDVFQGWFGIGSQLDGLSHAGQHGVFYNCRRGADFTQTTGVTAMGIEKIPPLVARGLVLDMTAHFGVAHLAGGQHFSIADVEAVAEAQQTPIREGDVVLFHTGWTEAKMTAEPDTWRRTEPGISEEVAHYLAAKKVLAVASRHLGGGRGAAPDRGQHFCRAHHSHEGARHLSARDHEYRPPGAGSGIRVPVRAGPAAGTGFGAGHDRSGGAVLNLPRRQGPRCRALGCNRWGSIGVWYSMSLKWNSVLCPVLWFSTLIRCGVQIS